jgi:hypothetical protein
MIQRRKRIEKTMGVIFIAVALGHVADNRLAIFDDVPVAVDDCVTFE